MTLHDYITSSLGRPFRYGTNDCVQFAGGWIRLRTGLDVFPKYRTKREAVEILGDRDVADFLTPHFTEVAKLMSLPGDVAIMPSQDGIGAFGIVTGDVVVAFGPGGLSRFDLLAALRVFRIIT